MQSLCQEKYFSEDVASASSDGDVKAYFGTVYSSYVNALNDASIANNEVGVGMGKGWRFCHV